MKYQILLSNRKTGEEALIECPSNLILEELSVKIKVALQLPYCDRSWHRFIVKGKVYVPDEHVIAEPEIKWEATGYYDYGYGSSDKVRLGQMFTVLGSAITYLQDGCFSNEYKVRCTLVCRI